MSKTETIKLEQLKAVYEKYTGNTDARWDQIEEQIADVSVGQPIILRVLIILGSQIAAFSMIGFMFMADMFDDDQEHYLMAIIYLSAAIGLPFIKKGSTFLEPFAFTCGVVGLTVLFISLDQALEYKTVDMAYTGLLVFPMLWLATRSGLQQYASVAALFFCFAVIQWENKWHEGIHLLITICGALMTFFMLHEARLRATLSQFSDRFNPIMSGVTSVLGMLLVVSVNKDLFDSKEIHGWWFSSVMLTIMLMISVDVIVKRSILPIPRSAALLAAALIGASCIFAPGILASILLIVLAHYAARYTYLVAGTIALIFFVISFYYNLNISLLSKSLILAGTGVVFILIYVLFSKWMKNKFPTDEK